MYELKLSPSILSADFGRLGEDIKTADRRRGLHPLMYGWCLCTGISWYSCYQSIRKCSDKVFDVHLMIEHPDQLIPEFAKAGADIIVVHAEACKHLHRTIQLIHSLGVKAGVALNPATPLSVLDYVLEDLDMILLMTVNPGFGGQSYIPAMTEKIRTLRHILEEKGLQTDIEIDGGVDTKNLRMVIEAGANVLVSGSKIFGGDIAENVHQFKAIMAEYTK
ncbi:MAG: ribulose-phosphate 3-epimerase [Coprococcus sp.]